MKSKNSVTLKELGEESNKVAKEKGFWKDYDELMLKVSDDTKMMQLVKDLFKSQKMLLIVSEVCESMESLRHHKFTCLTGKVKDYLDELIKEGNIEEFKDYFLENIKDTLEDEMADAFIRMGDFCKQFNIDIDAHIKYKNEYNKTRGNMHGKKF